MEWGAMMNVSGTYLFSFRGEHLVNFEADHMEIAGLNRYDQLNSVFQLIEDNVMHHDEASV